MINRLDNDGTLEVLLKIRYIQGDPKLTPYPKITIIYSNLPITSSIFVCRLSRPTQCAAITSMLLFLYFNNLNLYLK